MLLKTVLQYFFYVLATEGSKSLKSEASESSKQETASADPDLNMINSYLEDTSEIRAVPEAFDPTRPCIWFFGSESAWIPVRVNLALFWI
jgi:hypothetical protein